MQYGMQNADLLVEKWSPILDHEKLDPITDAHRRRVTAVLLENQENAIREEREFLYESPNINTYSSTGNPGFSGSASPSGPVAGYDPVLISMIRRSMPNLMAYDLASVQPLNGPVGLIFAMRARYEGQNGRETFFDEVDTSWSGQGSAFNNIAGQYVANSDGSSVGFGTTNRQTGANPGLLSPASNAAQFDYNVGQGMRTDDAEGLGYNGDQFNQMGFSIEKATVTAKSRALKAEYSLEFAQDFKAIHGGNAEAELANILSGEIMTEINRELIRTIYKVAEPGAQHNVATPGIFDLDVDSNGRWSVEKFKGLLFQIERDANAIMTRTRRGKGNIIMCSADVASALTAAGVLDYTPALNSNLNVDEIQNTFAGVLQGKYRVYIDPYSGGSNPNAYGGQYYVVGYKGSLAYDAGLFYCPYVPLQMVRAVGENSFQPKIAFKTRYGMIANPFAEGPSAAPGDQGLGRLKVDSNRYYRRVRVQNLM
jgi:hypothetical protein